MYSILFSILLASTYVSAIPMPLGLKIINQPDKEEERERKTKLEASFEEANRQIGKMQEVLKDPNDPRIKTAFGPTPNLPEISAVVDALATKNVKVQSLDPGLADNNRKLGDNRRHKVVNAFTERENGKGEHIALGSTFFSNTKEQQAGTIIHEATHYLAGTGDHHDTTDNRIIPFDEPLPPAANPPAERVVTNGGYADTATTPGPKYENMRDSVSNTYQNADSYRLFASLCSRSLYKRAPGDDDSKLQCNLPPDFFEKKAAIKAAMKAAAEKGTTTAANKVTTSSAAGNSKASTTKSTGVKGAEHLKGTATKAFRKGTSTRTSTGVKAGKGLKTVRGTKAVKTAKGLKAVKGTRTAKGLKAVKGTRTAKGLKMAKPGKGLKAVKGTKTAKGLKTAKGIKTTKPSKGLKAVKGTKATKGAKTVKGLKTAKPGSKAVKGAKAIKGVKAAKGIKRVKTTKAGKGVKVAKGVKAAKGAQRAEGKSSKAVKATKSTAARKTVSGAKTATRAATKAASHASVKAVAPKAAVKVAAAIPKKGLILPRDLGMILDELE